MNKGAVYCIIKKIVALDLFSVKFEETWMMEIL